MQEMSHSIMYIEVHKKMGVKALKMQRGWGITSFK